MFVCAGHAQASQVPCIWGLPVGEITLIGTYLAKNILRICCMDESISSVTMNTFVRDRTEIGFSFSKKHSSFPKKTAVP